MMTTHGKITVVIRLLLAGMLSMGITAANSISYEQGTTGEEMMAIDHVNIGMNTNLQGLENFPQTEADDSLSTTCLISLWNHRRDLDIKELAEELGVNHVWSHDDNYTGQEWREIIDAIKSINPDLKIWVPHYPHRDQGRHAFDFDIDAVIINLWGNDPELIARGPEHLAAGLEHHPNRPVMAGLYLSAGPDGGRWLTENEFRTLLGHYVEMLNAGKIAGLRMFSAGQFLERPEYIGWAREVLQGVTCR